MVEAGSLLSGILPLAKSKSSDFHATSSESVKPLGGFVNFGFHLPGDGSPYTDEDPSGACGEILVHRTMGCLEVDLHFQQALDEDRAGKIVVKLKSRTCLRSSCPVCYEKWAGKQAGIIAHRIESYRIMRYPKGKAVHVTASVPLRLYYLVAEDYRKLRRMAQKRFLEAGLYGGCLIFHDKRFRDNGMPYFSPHFHFMGFGWLKKGVPERIYEESGWVVKNHGVRRDVGATALYQLSHCGIHEDYHTVVWFGCLAYNNKSKFKAPKMIREDPVCPICGELLRPVEWAGSGDWAVPKPESEGFHFLEPDESWVYTTRYRGDYD